MCQLQMQITVVLKMCEQVNGDKSFTAAGPRARNSLPSYLRRDITTTDYLSKN